MFVLEVFLISALTTMTMFSQTPRASISLSTCWMEGVWVYLSTCTECTWKLMTPAPWHLLILLSLIPPVILILRWTRSVRHRSRGSRRRKGPCDTQTASPCRRMRFFITEILMTRRNKKRKGLCVQRCGRDAYEVTSGVIALPLKYVIATTEPLRQAKNAGIVVHVDMLIPYYIAFLRIHFASPFAAMMLEIGL